MADEVPYASGGVESNKRKYEDSQTPPPSVPRRPTGFSSTPDVAVPLPSYNSVPPPMNEIEMAKQKAQEIAARLLNNADATKRVRVENGAGGGGYDSNDGGTGFSSAPFPPTGMISSAFCDNIFLYACFVISSSFILFIHIEFAPV